MRSISAIVLTSLALISSLVLTAPLKGAPAQVQSPPAQAPLTLITAQGRRLFPTTMVRGQEMVATDELVSAFQLAAREDNGAGGITLSYKGRTAVISRDQAVASVGGRLLLLPSPAVRNGRRWLVPLEVVARVIPSIYDARVELRRPSRLLIVGDLRVPRVTVRLDSIGPPTRLSIEASPASLITPAIESGRVAVRLDADALDVAPLPQAGGLLEEARTEGNTVVLMLSSRAGQARATQGAGDNLSRITVDVPLGTPAAATSAQTPAAPAATPAPPPEPAPTPPPAGVRTIVLDPGHGGADAGATGTTGAQEKTLTLDIARRAKSLLETRLGMRVVLTRDDDTAVSLDERTARANSSRADLFVGLHLNASITPTASGAEIYQLRGENGPPSHDRISEPLPLPVTTGGIRTLSFVPWNQAQSRHREASTLLANLLESALRPQIPMSAQSLREAPLRVLAGLDMPAVVIELAYLTNPAQSVAAQSEEFQNRAAQGMLEAVTAFRSASRGIR